MSVICQNFVQNAWKKDLCSNCFKSLGDHESDQHHHESPVMPVSCAVETHQLRNGITNKNGTRYVSQATTIYQSRGLHTTWTSLLAERQEKKNGFFQLENGFQGKLLTISTKTNGVDKKSTPNGEVTKLNGLSRSNGLTNGYSMETVELTMDTNGVIPNGILKSKSVKKSKTNVGFDEDSPLVIGYGGNDYDSDDNDWETGSDDGDFPIEALDCTDEDRAITKITKENTEFNSDNANLLRASCLTNGSTEESKKSNNISNGSLPNGTKEKEEAVVLLENKKKSTSGVKVSEKEGDQEDKNISVREKETSDINKSENKVKTPNGVVHQSPSQHPCIRRKDPAPPQASVKPFLRETAQTIVEAKERLNPKIKASDDVISAIENKLKSLKNEGDAPKNEAVKINGSESTKIKVTAETKSEDNSVKNKEVSITKESPKLIIDGNSDRNRGTQIETKMSNGYKDSPQSMAYARKSFLHGKAADDPDPDESAIYTPGKGDLFVANRNSSSSTDATEDSDSGTSTTSGTFVCSAELNLSNKIGKATSSAQDASGKTTGSEKRDSASETGGSKPISEPSKPERTSIASSTARDDSRSASPDPTRKSVKFAPSPESENVYGRLRKISNTTQESSPSSSARSSIDSGEETPIYYAVSSTIIHTENQANIPHVATVRRTPVCHYAETNIFPEAERKSTGSPEKETAKNRESRLAALAQELELARHGNGSKRPAPSPPKQMEQGDRLPPTSQSTPSTPTMSTASSHNQVSTETETNYGNVTIYGKPAIYSTPNNGNGSSKGKSATISAVHGKKVLALLNFDESAKSSKKTNKFSIKKFLKRGKDTETLDNIFHVQQPVSPTSPNPKAWKNNDFDRTKMKLEIIHPMDLASKEGGASVQSSSEVINISKAYDCSPISSSERSLSSSQLSVSQDGIYDDEATWQGCPRNNGPTSMQVPGNSENHDIENSSTILSTFSPNSQTPKPTGSSPTSASVDSTQGATPSAKSSHGKPIRPPKPPPPPRLKSLPLNKTDKDEANVVVSNGTSNLLPAKPQVPKRLFRPSMKSEYANLGDVRSPMAPKKPERFPNSRPSTPGSMEQLSTPYYDDDNAYELVGVETDSNYNTQSDITDEITYSDAEPIYTDGYSMCTFDFATQEPKPEESTSSQDTLWRDSDRVTVTVQRGAVYDRQGDGPNKPPGSQCGDKIDTMAWLSLEQSYAIVAAANHEVLAKLIDQVLNQKTNVFQKPDGRNVTWEDFYLQQNNPVRIIGDKVLYHAVFRHTPKREVTLLVTAHPSGLLRRETFSKNFFLGKFSDLLPRSSIDVSWCNQATSDTVQAQIYILPKSDVGSIQSYFFDKSIPIEKGDASVFEKELCFVYLQLINALKILQAHGTEDVDMNQEELILSKDEKDQMSNLIFLSGDFVTESEGHGSLDKVSLCQYALIFLLRVLHIPDAETLNHGNHNFPLSPCARKIFITVAKALSQEKASSLSKAKNLLEFHLWGPKDKVYGCLSASGSQRMEETLQRWLDIERAQNLRLLVRSHKNISACEEHQLQFLVRTSAKALKDMTSALSFEKL